MCKNWPWKWTHHPDSQSLGPLADILSVKVENVTKAKNPLLQEKGMNYKVIEEKDN